MEKFITGDPKALTILKHLVSLKTIKYKEKDELVDIIRVITSPPPLIKSLL